MPVSGIKINGCVLSDQIKSLDWTVRNIEFIERIEEEKLDEVIHKISTMIDK